MIAGSKTNVESLAMVEDIEDSVPKEFLGPSDLIYEGISDVIFSDQPDSPSSAAQLMQ